MRRDAAAAWLQGLWGFTFLALVVLMGWGAADPARWTVMMVSSVAIASVVVMLFRGDRLSRRGVLLWAIAARIALFWMLPVLSDDVYRYLWDGMLQQSGVNPYLYVPADAALARFHAEPIYDALNSPEYFTVYPPVSQFFFAFAAKFLDGEWQPAYFVLKVLFVGMEIAGLFLLSRMTHGPSLALYAWNPLVLLSVAGQVHSDTLLVPLLVATIWFARRNRGGPAAIALSLAGLVKLYPFLLFPFLWHRFGWRSVWPGVVTAAVACLPFASAEAVWNVCSSLVLYVGLFEFNAGVYYALKLPILFATGLDAGRILGPLLAATFLLGTVAAYRLDRANRREGRGMPSFLEAVPRLSLRRGFVLVLGLHLALATTVHPWYLVPLLAVTIPAIRPSWHWYWLSISSIGTYMLYAGGPYWPFVVVGWAGWIVLLTLRNRGVIVDVALRLRARGKARRILDMIPVQASVGSVLDLGAAEGYVGRELAVRRRWNVTLADVRPANRTRLPYVTYDGRRLPFSDGQFDLAVLYFVLHHSGDPVSVLREAARVSRGYIFVAESIFVSERERARLEVLDRGMNGLRDTAAVQETRSFRSIEEWRRLFHSQQLRLMRERTRGRILHRQAYFLLRVPDESSPPGNEASFDANTRKTASGEAAAEIQ